MSLFDSVDDSENVFGTPKPTPSPPPPLADVSDHDTIGDSDGVKVEGGEEVEKEGEEEGGGEEGEVVGEKIDNEGRGTQKEENESVEDSCLTDPLTASQQVEEKTEARPEEEEDIFKPSPGRTTADDQSFTEPTSTSKPSNLFSEDGEGTSLFSSSTATRSKDMFAYTADDGDDLFKSTEQTGDDHGTAGEEEFVMVSADEVPSREDAERQVEQARKEREEREKAAAEAVEEKKIEPAKTYSEGLTYEERAAMRRYQREQRKQQAASKKIEKPAKPVTRSDVKSKAGSSVGSDHKSKPHKPAAKPSPSIGRRTGTSTTTIKVETRRTPTPEHMDHHTTSSSTDPQEQIHLLTSKLHKAQAENAALTRDKKTLESQLEVQRSKIKQLESTLAKREAEIAELKRKARESKPSPSHTRAKKVESPGITRKISDSSPRQLRRVGSGEKGESPGITHKIGDSSPRTSRREGSREKGESPGISRKITDSSPRSLRRLGSGEKTTPTGSPSELRKQRSGVTRESTSSVADTRRKFIKHITASPDTRKKPRLSRSEEGEAGKTSKDKPPPAPRKESTPVPPKPSKPIPPVKTDRVKSPVPAKPEKKATPPQEKATPLLDKTTPPQKQQDTVISSVQRPEKESPSPISIESSKETTPVLTSNPQATPPVGEDRIKSPTYAETPPLQVNEASAGSGGENTGASMDITPSTTTDENGIDDDTPRALRLISSFEKKTTKHAQDAEPWKAHVRKKSGDNLLNDEVAAAKPSSPEKDSSSGSPPRQINPAGSPQLAPAPQKDSEREKENDMKYTTLHVADTDVPLRDKVLMKSLSNTSTSSSDSKQSLSMFDNRAKRASWVSQQKETCEVCKKTVYAMERLEADKLVYHKTCFKCSVCSKTLGVGTYAALQGIIYCKTHFKQLFKMKGNYDEGFGREQHKTKWNKKDDQ